MNKFIIAILAFFVVNLIFSTFGFLFPTVNKANFMPYQLWCHAIIIFLLILPLSIGSYVYE